MVFGLGGLERRLNGALHIANRVSDIGNSNPFMSRRDILKLGGATGAGTLLAACGDDGEWLTETDGGVVSATVHELVSQAHELVHVAVPVLLGGDNDLQPLTSCLAL